MTRHPWGAPESGWGAPEYVPHGRRRLPRQHEHCFTHERRRQRCANANAHSRFLVHHTSAERARPPSTHICMDPLTHRRTHSAPGQRVLLHPDSFPCCEHRRQREAEGLSDSEDSGVTGCARMTDLSSGLGIASSQQRAGALSAR
jgi:hypothetical protein